MNAKESLRLWQKKPPGIALNDSIFRTISRFCLPLRQVDRNKILRDPCALTQTPYNSSPGVVA
ncbi:hypothetical protein ARC310_15680 [Pantoea ananatis]|jgi:hypothetical protein|nr:hypothetical protein [Pantoea ananatis]PZD59913.1 hypothetical protein ARC310_15680 [Pantoea ananatis]PZD62961.1 hypothetical protein ARC272_13095 [Pantoea ananatis]PZD68549.1 hypothetical protein ARC311_06090 [Pantoea ananatis]